MSAAQGIASSSGGSGVEGVERSVSSSQHNHLRTYVGIAEVPEARRYHGIRHRLDLLLGAVVNQAAKVVSTPRVSPHGRCAGHSIVVAHNCGAEREKECGLDKHRRRWSTDRAEDQHRREVAAEDYSAYPNSQDPFGGLVGYISPFMIRLTT